MLHAVYLDGQTPQRRSAQVSLHSKELEFTIDGVFGTRSVHLEYVKIERIRHDLLYVHLDEGAGERLEISDPLLIEQILKVKSSWGVDVTTNVGQKIVVALVIVIALGAALYFSTPLVAKYIAHHIPVEQELRVQSYVIEEIKEEICGNAAQHKVLQALADRLLADSGQKYPVKVLYGSKEVFNAFALPGGVIIFYPAIIKKMKSPEQLAGVMAHEIQHQVRRHITTHIVRAALMTVVWNILMGDFTGFMVVDPSTIATLVSYKYSRDAEREADFEGAKMLEKSGIAISPLADFFDTLMKMPGMETMAKLEFVSTHPLDNRGKILRDQFGHVKTTREIVTPEEWELLRRGCVTAKLPAEH